MTSHSESCCEAHATDDDCIVCGHRIDYDDGETRYYGMRQTAPARMFDPPEHECAGPFCINCWQSEKDKLEREGERDDVP